MGEDFGRDRLKIQKEMVDGQFCCYKSSQLHSVSLSLCHTLLAFLFLKALK